MKRQFTLARTAVDALPLLPAPDAPPVPPAPPETPGGTASAEPDTWTQSQINTMARTIEHLAARLPAGQTARYDVAELAATLGLMPAGVALLRITLDAMAARGAVQRDWSEIGADRTYVLGGGSVPLMTDDTAAHTYRPTIGVPVPVEGQTPPTSDGPRSGLNFGQALAAMKLGARAARDGWVIDGKWICLRSGYPDGIAVNDNTAEAFGVPPGTVVVFQPYFQMCEKDGSIRTWNKGDQDVIADDWYLVEGSGNLPV